MAGMDTKAARRRWYLPMPAWLVWGAAVATGLLFACERWRWFPLHYQKGWPVLLAVAVVGAVLVLIPAWMFAGLLLRRRVQFVLGTLLVFVTLCAVVCSWLGVRIKQARRQAEAVAAIRQKHEGCVVYETQLHGTVPPMFDTPSPGPEPLGKLLGGDFFDEVQWLQLGGWDFGDANMAKAAEFRQIEYLYLYGDTVTDASLSQLGCLTNLTSLELHDAKVTDEGVKKLRHLLPNCKIDVKRGYW